MNTYTSGFTLKSTKDISKNDIYELCISLNTNFGKGYGFLPEPISEGGIEMVSWPDKEAKMYKSMRIGIKYNGNKGKWPWANINTVMQQWQGNQEIIFAKNQSMSTFLKAFHNAPSWTIQELELFESSFRSIGYERKG
eukprot:804593_1